MSNITTCPPGNSLLDLDHLPIPKDHSFAVIPGQNVSVPWMVRCCAPNPVNLVNNCYLWCQLPPSQIYHGSNGLDTDFDSCLKINGLNVDETSISGYSFANAAGRVGPTIQGVGIWALLAAGILRCVF